MSYKNIIHTNTASTKHKSYKQLTQHTNNTHIHITHIQTHTQTDIQTYRQTHIETHRYTQICKRSHIHTHKHTHMRSFIEAHIKHVWTIREYRVCTMMYICELHEKQAS